MVQVLKLVKDVKTKNKKILNQKNKKILYCVVDNVSAVLVVKCIYYCLTW